MTGYILGVDGGGTKTVAIKVDASGALLSHEVLLGLDPTAGSGWEADLAALAGRMGPVSATVLGLPYHGEISAITSQQILLGAQLFGEKCRVVNDVAVAFEGAFAGMHGMLILAGTGSMAWAMGPKGTHRVGGWGDAFGDEGSAYWIGRTALAMCSKHLDGRAVYADFALPLLNRMGVAQDALTEWTYTQAQPRAAIAGVARHVSALADAGVADAQNLMQAAALQLAEMGKTATRFSGLPSAMRWATAGSVLKDATLARSLSAAMGCAPMAAILPPAGGAALAAAKLAGWNTGLDFITKLAAQLTEQSECPVLGQTTG